MNRSRSSSCDFFKKRSQNSIEKMRRKSSESLMSMISLSSIDSTSSMSKIDGSIKKLDKKQLLDKKTEKKKIKREREMTYEKDLSKSPQIEKWMEFMSENDVSVTSNGWGFYVDLKDSN